MDAVHGGLGDGGGPAGCRLQCPVMVVGQARDARRNSDMYMTFVQDIMRCVYLSSTSLSRLETPHLHRVTKHDCIKHKKKRKEKDPRRRKAGEEQHSKRARPARC